ncbi:hypothetical protein AJ88_21695 [Mesorhizobium amorphae CCBAU 01583]|nr:hypothetical protein AJ88_21695 [Mesorhizobium amorphae CCBAU 01583]
MHGSLDKARLDLGREFARPQVLDIDIIALRSVHKSPAEDIPEHVAEDVVGDRVELQSFRSHAGKPTNA